VAVDARATDAGGLGDLGVVDRKTGKPIYPIPEVKVPQDASEKTAATQPEPTMERFSPAEATPQAVENAEAAVAGDKPKPTVTGSPIFTPMSTDPSQLNLVGDSAVGGDNWPASSYDSEKSLYFVCSQAGSSGLIVPPEPQQYKEGETYIGSDTVVSSGFNTTGYLTAYDMSTGKIAWQDTFGESCYSGAVSTAGGLVFVGQNNGELQAFDVENGKKLWSFQTGAGANTTVTVFENEGEEKIALYAGGNSLAATSHGENFWVFSLSGKMTAEEGEENEAEGTTHADESGGAEEGAGGEAESGEEAAEEAGGGEEVEGGDTEGGEETASAPNAEAGTEVFAENCSTCHGATGHGGNGGPDLTTMPKAKEQKGAEEQVTNGGGGMPAFKGTLSSEEISDVAAYVVEKIVGK
jgi:alcohol dehydrogenase (cytochrome c)